MTREIVSKFVNRVEYEYDPTNWKKFKDDFNRTAKNILGKNKTIASAFKNISSIKLKGRQFDKVKNALEKVRKAVVKTVKAFPKLVKAISKATMKIMKLGIGASKAALKIGGLASAAVAGLGYIGKEINESTVRMDAFSASVKASTGFTEGFTSAISPLGLEFNNTIDLMAEMNKKFGESAALVARNEKPLGAVSDAMKMLNLDYKEIAKLKPEEQFLSIMQAAQKLDDSQIAVSATDMLLGGEAGKITGFIRTLDTDIDLLARRFGSLGETTGESREGAKEFIDSWRELSIVGTSIARDFAGTIGGVIAPELDKISRWLMNNKSEIRNGIGKAAEWLGVKFRELGDFFNSKDGSEFFSDLKGMAVSVFDTISKIGDVLPSIATSFKVVATVLKPIALLIGGIVDAITWVYEKIEGVFSGLKSKVSSATVDFVSVMKKVNPTANMKVGDKSIPVNVTDNLNRREERIKLQNTNASPGSVSKNVVDNRTFKFEINTKNIDENRLTREIKRQINKHSVDMFQDVAG